MKSLNLDRIKALQNLKKYQNNIVFESEEDEGASEHYYEVQDIIDSIESNKTDAHITELATGLSMSKCLEYK